MSKTYEQIYYGEWNPLPSAWTLACCDCGLVHDIDIRWKKGELQVRMNENRRATGQKRRHFGIKLVRTKKK